MIYLNLKTDGVVETIDEFDNKTEATKMAKEYRMASNYYSGIYLSQRATKDWNNN